MVDDVVRWSDGVDDVIDGDLTAAAAWVTPAGGVVLTGVSPCGLRDRDAGMVGFTTPFGIGQPKLARIRRDPRVGLAFHAREHGAATGDRFVLAQGTAAIDIAPSQERLDEFLAQTEPYLGRVRNGPLWDRLMREYYYDRVFVDIVVRRMAVLSDGTSSDPDVSGDPWPPDPEAQAPPNHGTGPRVDVAKAAARVTALPHRLLGYRDADGFPVIVPVDVVDHGSSGMQLVAQRGRLPYGGRRAGLLGHLYEPQVTGLRTRTFTGWLDVGDDGTVVYAPHTESGFAAPRQKTMFLVANGLMTKYYARKARRGAATTPAVTPATGPSVP